MTNSSKQYINELSWDNFWLELNKNWIEFYPYFMLITSPAFKLFLEFYVIKRTVFLSICPAWIWSCDVIWIFPCSKAGKLCFITASLTVDVSSVMEQPTESLVEFHRPHHLCRSTLRVSSIKSYFSNRGPITRAWTSSSTWIFHLPYGKAYICNLFYLRI